MWLVVLQTTGLCRRCLLNQHLTTGGTLSPFSRKINHKYQPRCGACRLYLPRCTLPSRLARLVSRDMRDRLSGYLFQGQSALPRERPKNNCAWCHVLSSARRTNTKRCRMLLTLWQRHWGQEGEVQGEESWVWLCNA